MEQKTIPRFPSKEPKTVNTFIKVKRKCEPEREGMFFSKIKNENKKKTFALFRGHI